MKIIGFVKSVIVLGLHCRQDVVLAKDGKEVKGPLEHRQKANQRKTLCQRRREKRGRKSKLLTPIPGQDVDVPLVVGGALVVGDTTLSPLTGGLNANKSSLGQSTDTQSNDDATIGENTVA